MKPRVVMMISFSDSMCISYVFPLSFFTLPEQVGQLPAEKAQCLKQYDFSQSNLDQCSQTFMKSYLKALYEVDKRELR